MFDFTVIGFSKHVHVLRTRIIASASSSPVINNCFPFNYDDGLP